MNVREFDIASRACMLDGISIGVGGWALAGAGLSWMGQPAALTALLAVPAWGILNHYARGRWAALKELRRANRDGEGWDEFHILAAALQEADAAAVRAAEAQRERDELREEVARLKEGIADGR